MKRGEKGLRLYAVAVPDCDNMFAVKAYGDKGALVYDIIGEESCASKTRLELLAFTEAIESLEEKEHAIILTDSYYVYDCIVTHGDHRMNRDLYKRAMARMNRHIEVDMVKPADPRYQSCIKMVKREYKKRNMS